MIASKTIEEALNYLKKILKSKFGQMCVHRQRNQIFAFRNWQRICETKSLKSTGLCWITAAEDVKGGRFIENFSIITVAINKLLQKGRCLHVSLRMRNNQKKNYPDFSDLTRTKDFQSKTFNWTSFGCKLCRNWCSVDAEGK